MSERAFVDAERLYEAMTQGHWLGLRLGLGFMRRALEFLKLGIGV